MLTSIVRLASNRSPKIIYIPSYIPTTSLIEPISLLFAGMYKTQYEVKKVYPSEIKPEGFGIEEHLFKKCIELLIKLPKCTLWEL